MRTATRRITTGALAAAVAGLLAAAPGTAAHAGEEVPEPEVFTSEFRVVATPDMVVDNQGAPVPGEEGAWGSFRFRLNSAEDVICYDIRFFGVTPPYLSPAKTATHIHQAADGEFGPPRLAFPDPERDGRGGLRSSGCMRGPFTTGLEGDDGNDTGAGFTVAQIEDDPSSFYADTHTADFPAGAIRGQLKDADRGYGRPG
ncbi:CHRD domain-containing protein [Nocardiopsis sp. NPDC058789]|uniref:CHRD domain-containing protein n=1 Tax=Nocardiopsis eucommiae TaxID=2831970 RepID=A0A975QKK3_9ACTN|nr:CHRD domain-containing protein [Nocardiopsis eucommiae]